MRAWVFSDLHLKNVGLPPPSIPTADVALVAGDICEGSERAIGWLEEHVRPHMPVIYTLGNHEFYHGSIKEELTIARRAAKRAGISLLEQDTLELSGVRFFGTTLWTDYFLYAGGDEAKRTASMDAARRGLMDHHLIYQSEYSTRLFDPIDALAINSSSRTWLSSQLAEFSGEKAVVLTHHAPHPNSVHPKWSRDPLTPAFVSDLSGIITLRAPVLWVHGHTHSNFDYRVGSTRIVCNPRGYSGENSSAFRWDFVVEI